MDNRIKKLFKNSAIFAISSFGPKILSFLLVPLYTSFLTTKDYGIADIIITTVALLLPLITADICDAVLRYTIENASNITPFLIGLKITIIGNLFLLILLAVLLFLLPIKQYFLLLVISYFLIISNSIYSLLSCYFRGIDELYIVAKSGILNSIIALVFNIVLIAILKKGLYGYLFANILGLVSSNVYLGLKLRINLKNKIKSKNYVLQKKMLHYSFPLAFSNIGWWVNSMSDKYFVSILCGLSANGIYSISYKIPTILSVIQNIFYQALQLTSFQEIQKKDSENFFQGIYQAYNVLMVLTCSFLILSNKLLASFLFAKDFFIAWRYVPPLLVSIIFVALAGFLESILAAYNTTNIVAYTTVLGAVINIVLNYMLIAKYGIYGAAIATMISFGGVWLFRIIAVKKVSDLKLNIKTHILSYALLIIQYFFSLQKHQGIIFQLLIIVLLIYLYKKILLKIKGQLYF